MVVAFPVAITYWIFDAAITDEAVTAIPPGGIWAWLLGFDLIADRFRASEAYRPGLGIAYLRTCATLFWLVVFQIPFLILHLATRRSRLLTHPLATAGGDVREEDQSMPQKLLAGLLVLALILAHEIFAPLSESASLRRSSTFQKNFGFGTSLWCRSPCSS